jgi:hypothetical protein
MTFLLWYKPYNIKHTMGCINIKINGMILYGTLVCLQYLENVNNEVGSIIFIWWKQKLKTENSHHNKKTYFQSYVMEQN